MEKRREESGIRLEIEPIAEKDAEQLAAVAVRAYSDHYLHFWSDGGDWYLDRSFSVENLRRELADERNNFYLAVFEGEPVGFLKTRPDNPMPDGNKGFEVERIYLTNRAQGNGIGTALMDFAIAHAAELGSKLVWLKVMDSSEGAIAFYKKLGFLVCGTETLQFPQMKQELRGMYIMQKCVFDGQTKIEK